MKVIEVSSAKGGVGTTTTACALALALENMGNTVLILDTTGTDSVVPTLGLNPVFGLPTVSWKNITVSNIVIGNHDVPVYEGYDYLVVDSGNTQHKYGDRSVTRIGVVRNEYLAIRRMMHYPVDMFVSFTIANNALTAGDVSNVLRKTVIEAPMDSAVARSIDAGLFPRRWESIASEWSNRIVHSLVLMAVVS